VYDGEDVSCYDSLDVKTAPSVTARESKHYDYIVYQGGIHEQGQCEQSEKRDCMMAVVEVA